MSFLFSWWDDQPTLFYKPITWQENIGNFLQDFLYDYFGYRGNFTYDEVDQTLYTSSLSIKIWFFDHHCVPDLDESVSFKHKMLILLSELSPTERLGNLLEKTFASLPKGVDTVSIIDVDQNSVSVRYENFINDE